MIAIMVTYSHKTILIDTDNILSELDLYLLVWFKSLSLSNFPSTMSKPTLYYTAGSPPARAVLFLIRYLDIDVEVKTLNLLQREQHSEEYLKINPAHQVPTLVDGAFVLTESRAILAYLINSRKSGSDLYPSDPKARARVDQRLSYDHVLFTQNGLLIVSN